MQLQSVDPVYSAYIKAPVILLLRPLNKELIWKAAYHTGIVRYEREVEKICYWFNHKYPLVFAELIWQKVRVTNVKPYRPPTLYDIQLKHHINYMKQLHTKPYILYQQGDYVGCVHLIG